MKQLIKKYLIFLLVIKPKNKNYKFLFFSETTNKKIFDFFISY
jgi:hypothetical protein